MSPAAKKARRDAALIRAAKIIEGGQAGAVALRRTPVKEVGYVDLASNTYACDTTGTITLISTIAQGASINQRIGKRATLKALQLRGFINAGTTAVYNDVVVMIIYDRQPTGSLPAITDVLTAVSPYAFMNDTNSDRFKVIRRMDFPLIGNTTTPATGQEVKSMDRYIPLNLPIVFKAAGTGAIGDIAVGAVYMITAGNNVAGNTAASLAVSVRTRFTD